MKYVMKFMTPNPVGLGRVSLEQETHQGQFFDAVNLVSIAVVACVASCIWFNAGLIVAACKTESVVKCGK